MCSFELSADTLAILTASKTKLAEEQGIAFSIHALPWESRKTERLQRAT